jgi:hypothetical protein
MVLHSHPLLPSPSPLPVDGKQKFPEEIFSPHLCMGGNSDSLL